VLYWVSARRAKAEARRGATAAACATNLVVPRTPSHPASRQHACASHKSVAHSNREDKELLLSAFDIYAETESAAPAQFRAPAHLMCRRQPRDVQESQPSIALRVPTC
jgi:hypothetical protein